MFPSFRQFLAMLRRLGLALAIGVALVWLAAATAHARPRQPPLLAAASRFLGARNFTHFHGPWCAEAVDRWLGMAGYRRLHSRRAIDFARYGRRTAPRPGALAVMRHHVGIVVRMTARGPLLLSGNHTHRVGLGIYPRRHILAYRSPL